MGNKNNGECGCGPEELPAFGIGAPSMPGNNRLTLAYQVGPFNLPPHLAEHTAPGATQPQQQMFLGGSLSANSISVEQAAALVHTIAQSIALEDGVLFESGSPFSDGSGWPQLPKSPNGENDDDPPYVSPWRKALDEDLARHEAVQKQWQKVKDAWPIEWESVRQRRLTCTNSAHEEFENCMKLAKAEAATVGLVGAGVAFIGTAAKTHSPVLACIAAIAGALAVGAVAHAFMYVRCLGAYNSALKQCLEDEKQALDKMWALWKAGKRE